MSKQVAAHLNHLDWKSLLNQKPPPSSVTKRSGLFSRQSALLTPSTPLASSPGGSQRAAETIPFLLLPVAIPKPANVKQPTDQPATDLLQKLAELKKKAASLVEAAAAADRAAGASDGAVKLLDRPQVLQDPLPPPQHVLEAGSSLWFADGDQADGGIRSSSHELLQYDNSAAGGSAVAAGPSGQVQLYRQQEGGRLAGADSSNGATSRGDRMATSLTGQSSGSSLLTTAHSPSLRVQQALARIRQLQHSTEEALQEGSELAG